MTKPFLKVMFVLISFGAAPAFADDTLASFLSKLSDSKHASADDALAAIRRLIRETAELRLEINRRVAPVGTIVAFGGSQIPQGWHLCDGSPIDRKKQPDFDPLFKAIGYAWGGSGDTFNLPDLRGMFLRGVAHGSVLDPDRDRRKTAASAASDAVGSTQTFSTARPQTPFVTGGQSQTHNHEIHGGNRTNHVGNDASKGRDMGMNNSFSLGNADRDHTHTIVSGGDQETRPVNAYVEFIIKYIDQ